MADKPRFEGEKQPLEKRVEYVRGVTYKAAVDLHEELNDNSYVLLRANNIQDGELRFDDVQYVDRARVKPKQLLQRGDIMICASSGSKGLVGKAALVRESMPVTFGAFCCVLRPKDNEAEYLDHYFQSRQYRRAIEEACSGSNINNLKAANFLSLVVPHYDDDSTRAISALFDSIDVQIKQAKDQLALLDSLVKSRFVEVFGDPVDGKKWPFVRLEDLCTKLGSGATPRGGKTAYKAEGVPLVRSMNVHNGRFVWKDLACIDDEQAAKLEGVTLMKGDVLLNITGASVARSCLLPDELAGGRVNQHVSIVRVDQKRMLPVLLNTVLISDSYQRLLLNGSRAAGATREAITKEALKRMTVPLPPLELQQEFASFVAQVDKSRFIAQQQIEKLQMLYDSLAQEYFA